MLNAGTGSVENVLNILQRLCSLLSSGLARQFAGGRINAQLAGYEHEAIGLHRLAVCAQRGRRLGSGYGFHLFAHIVLLLVGGAHLLRPAPVHITTGYDQSHDRQRLAMPIT